MCTYNSCSDFTAIDHLMGKHILLFQDSVDSNRSPDFGVNYGCSNAVQFKKRLDVETDSIVYKEEKYSLDKFKLDVITKSGTIADMNPLPDLQPLKLYLYGNAKQNKIYARFFLPRAFSVRLTLFDVKGRLIMTFFDGSHFEAGLDEGFWNALDGRSISLEIYLTRMDAGERFHGSLKLLLNK